MPHDPLPGPGEDSPGRVQRPGQVRVEEPRASATSALYSKAPVAWSPSQGDTNASQESPGEATTHVASDFHHRPFMKGLRWRLRWGHSTLQGLATRGIAPISWNVRHTGPRPMGAKCTLVRRIVNRPSRKTKEGAVSPMTVPMTVPRRNSTCLNARFCAAQIPLPVCT